MTGREARAVLARLPGHTSATVRALMRQGKALEAQRIVARQTRDGALAEEIIGALVRAAVTGQ